MTQIFATLQRGKTFTQIIPNAEAPTRPSEITFLRGEPKPVTEAVKALLEEAHDVVTVSNGEEAYAETRSKFVFTVGEASDAAAVTPQRRAR